MCDELSNNKNEIDRLKNKIKLSNEDNSTLELKYKNLDSN